MYNHIYMYTYTYTHTYICIYIYTYAYGNTNINSIPYPLLLEQQQIVRRTATYYLRNVESGPGKSVESDPWRRAHGSVEGLCARRKGSSVEDTMATDR